MSKVTYKCSECKSEQLMVAMDSFWNYELQQWISEEIDEDQICRCMDCGNHDVPVEVVVESDVV